MENKPVSKKKLETFFERLLLLLKGQVKQQSLTQNRVNEYLTRYGLKEVYEQLVQRMEERFVPKNEYDLLDNLYEECPSEIAPQAKKPIKQAESQTRHRSQATNNNIVDLFWDLDYRKQQQMVVNNLIEHSLCMAFSVSAPCETTQRWIISRLVRAVPNYKEAVNLTIDVQAHAMRHLGFGEFWEDLAKRFNTSASQDSVLNAICKLEMNRPVILTIFCNFCRYEQIQRSLLQDFWVPLVIGF